MADTSLTKIIADFTAVLTSQLSAGGTSAVISTNVTKGAETAPDGYYSFVINKNEDIEEHFVCTFTSSTKTMSDIKRVSRLTGIIVGAGLSNTHKKTSTINMVAFVPLARIMERLDGSQGLENIIKYADASSQTPSNDVDIVHKKFVDDALALKLNLSGGAMTGVLDMNANVITMGGAKITEGATPTANDDLATKAYVDGVAVAGAPDANETTKGIVEEATQAEVDAGTDTGSTGAKLFVPPSKIKTYVENKVDTSARALTQTLFTDGLWFDWLDGASEFEVNIDKSAGKIYNRKIMDESNRILFCVFPYTDGSNDLTIRTYRFNEYWQVTHQNFYHITNVNLDDREGMFVDIFGGDIYIGANSTGNDLYLYKYSVDSATGEITRTSSSTALTPRAGFMMVNASYIYIFDVANATSSAYEKFDKTTLVSAGTGTWNLLDSDGSTGINIYDVIKFYQSFVRMGDHYYAVERPSNGSTTYIGDGFDLDDSAGIKIIRRVSTDMSPWLGSEDVENQMVYGAENRLITFLETVKLVRGTSQIKSNQVIDSMKMTVGAENTVIVTTL